MSRTAAPVRGDCLWGGDPYVSWTSVAKMTMAEIASPCTKICAVDPGRALCVGCGRSLAEIERWTSIGDDERRRIMSDLPRRLALLRRTDAARVEAT